MPPLSTPPETMREFLCYSKSFLTSSYRGKEQQVVVSMSVMPLLLLIYALGGFKCPMQHYSTRTSVPSNRRTVRF